MEIMVYLGTLWGEFTNPAGEQIRYCKAFMISEQHPGSGSYSRGYRAEGFRLADEKLTRDIQPYDKVKVMFDRRGTIVSVEKIPA